MMLLLLAGCGRYNPSAVQEKRVEQPAWHPSGVYYVLPGRGLWVVSSLDGEAFPLMSSEQGILHPRFSADGGKLSWSEMTRNTCVSKSADFVITADGPRLENVTLLL